MNILSHGGQDFVMHFGWVLVHSLWQVPVVTACFALGRLVFRSANARYAMAMLALCTCVAWPMASLFTWEASSPRSASLAEEPSGAAPTASAALSSISFLSLPSSGPRRMASGPILEAPPIMPSWQERLRVLLPPFLPWGVTCWSLGVCVIMLKHLTGLWLLRCLRTRGTSPAGAMAQCLFEQAKVRLGLQRAVQLLESARIATPMVIGTFKPLVLLPAAMAAGLDARQLEALLAHELAHLRRWDDVANALQCCIEAVLFYHPALWWLSRVAREQRELCCDDLAVAGGVAPADLAQALGKLALWRQDSGQPSLAATGHMPVLARIQRLLRLPPKQPSPLAINPLPLAVLLLAAMPLLPVSAMKATVLPTRGRILDRNGVVLAETNAQGVRHYPYKSLAAHVIGYTRRHPNIAGDEEMTGSSGVEESRNEVLNSHEDVALTLDARMQHLAETSLAGWSGACVLLNPNDGDILALASVPSFDLNSFTPLTQEHFEKTLKAPGLPLFPRAYGVKYLPNSTFKLVTALAGLKSGAIDAGTIFEGMPDFQIGDRTFHNWSRQTEGPLDVVGAIRRSCNTWFYQAGLKTGAAPILEMAREMGFGVSNELPLKGEQTGALPSDQYVKKRGSKLLESDLASISIGQVAVVTPLQAAVAVASIGNGGHVFQPRLTMDQPKGRVRTQLLEQGLKPEQLALITKGMVEVVQGSSGVGRRAAINGIQVAAVTGTAPSKVYDDKARNRNLAWLVGFAPAEHPRIAFAMVYEGSPNEGVSGGSICAPKAKIIVEGALALLDGAKYELAPGAPQN